MKQRPFRWGIIGAGKIAGKFAEDLALHKDAELYAIASRSQKRADNLAEKYGVKKAFDSYEKMLTAGVDAVYVATRHPQHCEVTLLCLRAEIPVLCEKPLAMNSEEVNRMITAAVKNHTFLTEAIWTRFLPSIIKVKDIIDAGEIGEMLSLRADFGFNPPFDPNSRLFDRSLGGGALLDIGIYPLFLAQLIFGSPEKVQAVAHLGTTGADEETLMQMRYPAGGFAHLHATLRSHTPSTADIYGSKGSIHIHSRWHEAKSFTVKLNSGEKREYSFDFQGALGYYYEQKEVMQCVRNGRKESNLMPLNFSRDLMQTMDAVREEIDLEY